MLTLNRHAPKGHGHVDQANRDNPLKSVRISLVGLPDWRWSPSLEPSDFSGVFGTVLVLPLGALVSALGLDLTSTLSSTRQQAFSSGYLFLDIFRKLIYQASTKFNQTGVS